jgi:toxin ParE1/3/4
MKLEFTPQADADLENIFVYTVDRWGAAQADKYQAGLFRIMRQLASGQLSGRAVGSRRLMYFRYRYERHIDFFSTVADGIRIIRILHDAMDPARHL